MANGAAGTIWQTLCSDPSFSLLVEALNATSLAETLNSKGGTGMYTLFAPDNEAIEASEDFPKGSYDIFVVGSVPVWYVCVLQKRNYERVDCCSATCSKCWDQKWRCGGTSTFFSK